MLSPGAQPAPHVPTQQGWARLQPQMDKEVPSCILANNHGMLGTIPPCRRAWHRARGILSSVLGRQSAPGQGKLLEPRSQDGVTLGAGSHRAVTDGPSSRRQRPPRVSLRLGPNPNPGMRFSC